MEAMREALAAGVVLLLLAGCIWWLRRSGLARFAGGRGPARLLRVIERAALSPQSSVHLVRLSERGFLIAVSPAGCTVLESFDWECLEQAPRSAVESRP